MVFRSRKRLAFVMLLRAQQRNPVHGGKNDKIQPVVDNLNMINPIIKLNTVQNTMPTSWVNLVNAEGTVEGIIQTGLNILKGKVITKNVRKLYREYISQKTEELRLGTQLNVPVKVKTEEQKKGRNSNQQPKKRFKRKKRSRGKGARRAKFKKLSKVPYFIRPRIIEQRGLITYMQRCNIRQILPVRRKGVKIKNILEKKVMSRGKKHRIIQKLLKKYFKMEERLKVIGLLKDKKLSTILGLGTKRYFSQNLIGFLKEYIKAFYTAVQPPEDLRQRRRENAILKTELLIWKPRKTGSIWKLKKSRRKVLERIRSIYSKGKLRYDRIVLDKLNYKQRHLSISSQSKSKLSKFLLYLLMRVYLKKSLYKRTNIRKGLRRLKQTSTKNQLAVRLKILGKHLKRFTKGITSQSKKYIGAVKKTILIKVLIKVLRRSSITAEYVLRRLRGKIKDMSWIMDFGY
ncbi:hypothetical protein ACTFIU_002008 [Dictyostelium citrinum]